MPLANEYHPIEFPFKSHYLNWEDGKLHYIDEGKGPVLVFLHGHRSSSYVFRDLIKELMADYRCLALDFHGFGKSSTPSSQDYSLEWQSRQLAFWLKHLKIQEFALITCGSGCIPGLTYLLKQSLRPTALVMIHGWYWPTQLAVWQRFRLFLRREKRYWLKRVTLRRPERSLREDLRTAFHGFPSVGNPYPPAFHPTQVYGGDVQWLEGRADHLKRWKKVPSCLLWGDRNGRLKKKDKQRWQQLLPQILVRTYKRGRYLLLESHAAVCSKEIEQFLKACFQRIKTDQS
ncbi:MAG: alpha/beta fold hydrolase [Bacteroidota bacterium]